ncbi:MAG: hypothetical protein M1570_10060 [Chloroflexi bacterium]|nr:hypothetical protein [Chloroflexota bacterium]
MRNAGLAQVAHPGQDQRSAKTITTILSTDGQDIDPPSFDSQALDFGLVHGDHA